MVLREKGQAEQEGARAWLLLHWFPPTLQLIPALQDSRCSLLCPSAAVQPRLPSRWARSPLAVVFWFFLFLCFWKLLNSDLDLEACSAKLSNTPYEHQHKPAGLRREQVGPPCSTVLCLHLFHPSFMNIKESVCMCARKPAKHCWHRRSETLKTTHINRGSHASLGPWLNSLCTLVSVTLSPFSSSSFLTEGGKRESKGCPTKAQELLILTLSSSS